MKFLLLPFLIISQVFIVKTYKKEDTKYEEEHALFVKHLDELKDDKTLRIIGEIVNEFGQRERWYSTGFDIPKRRHLKRKYRETNDEFYKRYLDALNEMTKKEALLLIPFVACLALEFLIVTGKSII